ncbi:MAG: LapA family protein [Desulfovibrionales bacterium]|nr:LapA family protein [Desulfovibrionales bacterium]
MRFIKVLLLVVVFFLCMVFFQQNTAELSQVITLKVDLLYKAWESIPLPIYFLILGAFVLGAFVVTFFFILERVRLGSAVRKARKQVKKLEKEVNALRTNPLDEKASLPEIEPESEGTTEKATEA